MIKISHLSFVLLFVSMSSLSASFDCQLAKSSVEHMVCDNPVLSSLDEQLSHAYHAALSRNTDSVELIKHLQRSWVTMRSDITDPDELRIAYSIQILGLNSLYPDKKSDRVNGQSHNGSKPHSESSKATEATHNKLPSLEDYLKPYVNINGDYVSTVDLVDGNPNLVVCASSVANDVVNMKKQEAIKNGNIDLFFKVKDRIHTASANATYDMFIHDLSKANICQFIPAGGF